MKNSVILIPSFEPNSLLIDVIKNLFKEEFPILVVDDGSGKEFANIFNEIKPFVSFYSYEINRGKGNALKYGFSKIKEAFPEAKYVITADGDGQHSIKDIIKIHEELNKRNELVFGVREIDKTAPKKSRYGNLFSRFNRSLLTKEYLRDDQCGLRGFPIRYLDELMKISGNRYEYEMNQIVLFNLKRYPIYEVEIETIYLDKNSRSHFSPVKDTIRIHSRILSHSIIPLLTNALIIFFIVFLMDKGFNITAATSLSYVGGLVIYLSLSILIYRSRNSISRVLIEIVFSLLKMLSIIGLLYLFSYYLGAPYQLIASLGVILVSFINVPLAYLKYKIERK